MRPQLRPAALLARVALSIGACNRRRTTTDAPVPAPAPATADADADRAVREEAARRERDEADRRAREAAAREAAERTRAAIVAPVYFSFDHSDLDTEARRTLDAKLNELNRDPGLGLRIIGNTDERGSDEYNIALGMRRAVAARRYLTQRGVREDRLEITSMGEEQPVCTNSDESCWAQNRRDDFTITAGGPVARRE